MLNRSRRAIIGNCRTGSDLHFGGGEEGFGVGHGLFPQLVPLITSDAGNYHKRLARPALVNVTFAAVEWQRVEGVTTQAFRHNRHSVYFGEPRPARAETGSGRAEQPLE